MARKYPLTAKLLLQNGADPNLFNQYERTVFQDVLEDSYNPSLLKMFFKWSQPDVNIVDQNDHGRSLLQKLLHDLLLMEQYYQSTYETDFEYRGGSLISYTISLFRASESWNNFFINQNRRKEESIIIINQGVDLTHRDDAGELSLYQAVRLPRSEIAEWIIRKEGTRYLTNQDREFLVRLSVKRNHDKILRLLKKEPFPGKVSLRDKFFNSCHAFWSSL